MIVRRRIGAERQMIFFRFRAQIVQNNSRLDAREFFRDVQFQNLGKVF